MQKDLTKEITNRFTYIKVQKKGIAKFLNDRKETEHLAILGGILYL